MIGWLERYSVKGAAVLTFFLTLVLFALANVAYHQESNVTCYDVTVQSHTRSATQATPPVAAQTEMAARLCFQETKQQGYSNDR